MKDKHITGLITKYTGLRDIAIADLSIYLDNPVGVGEHSNIGDEIEKKIETISDCDDMIDCIQKYFGKPVDATPEETK
jgi:hypothetical protein